MSAHRSCTRCTRRMSSIIYDKHSLCLNCRDVQCSLDVRCDECKSWSLEVMLDYLKHRKSLVLKGKKKSTTPSTPSSSSSPSLPPAVTTTASVGSLLPLMSSDEKLRDYVHSFLANFLSQSGSIGSNQSLSAPLVVPHLAPLLRGGGCWGPRGQYPIQRAACHQRLKRKHSPPPLIMTVHDDYVRSGADRFLSSLVPCLGHLSSVNDGNDQLRVCGESVDVNRSVASALSPSALLFPLSDFGFASLYPSLSSSVTPTSHPSSFASLPSFSSSFWGLPSVAPSLPPSTVLVFSLPSVLSLSSAAPLPLVLLPPPPRLVFLLFLFLFLLLFLLLCFLFLSLLLSSLLFLLLPLAYLLLLLFLLFLFPLLLFLLSLPPFLPLLPPLLSWILLRIRLLL